MKKYKKLSRLLKDAAKDVRKTLKDPNFERDLGIFFMEHGDNKCSGCVAGAYLYVSLDVRSFETSLRVLDDKIGGRYMLIISSAAFGGLRNAWEKFYGEHNENLESYSSEDLSSRVFKEKPLEYLKAFKTVIKLIEEEEQNENNK